MKFLFLLLLTTNALASLPPTTSKGSADSTDLTTFKFRYPFVSISHSGTIATFGTVLIQGGGTNSSTALSGSSIMVSDGTSIVQGAAGTTTTLLHGNASGTPTYGAVSLTADVTGALPLANGGTNKNSTAVNGGVVWTDTDSMEITAAGTSGQMLQSNGAAAPTWISNSVVSSGAVLPDIQAVYFGIGANCASVCTTGNCTICTQVGTKITSVSWAAGGEYNLNGLDGSKYSCVANLHNGTVFATVGMNKASSSGSAIRISTAINAGQASVICLGNP